MKSKTLLYVAFGIAIFLLLVYYNYFQAQTAIKNTRPSPLSIDLVSYPELLTVSSRGTFLWRVESSPDLLTTSTTIYWGYQSSPSALTVLDSPAAVGYPYFLSDYTSGRYSLPNDFELRYMYDHSGRVFFRAYAKIGNQHLWSEEKSLEIVK